MYDFGSKWDSVLYCSVPKGLRVKLKMNSSAVYFKRKVT